MKFQFSMRDLLIGVLFACVLATGVAKTVTLEQRIGALETQALRINMLAAKGCHGGVQIQREGDEDRR